jgi:hypothetical protein
LFGFLDTNFSIVPVSESDNSQQLSNSGIDVKQEVVVGETGTVVQTQGSQQLAAVAEQTLVDKTKTVEKAKSQAGNENELSESDAGRTVFGSAEQTLNRVIVVANEIKQIKQVVVHEMAVTETLPESVQKCSASPEKTIADDQNSIGKGDEGGETGSMDVDSTVHVPNKGLIPSNPDSPRHDADVSDVPQSESSAQISNSGNDVASNNADVKQQVLVGETETAVHAETIGQEYQQLTAVSKKTSVNENKTAEEATWQAGNGNGNGVIVSDTGHTISGSAEQISDMYNLIFVANEFGEIKQVLVQETATTEILTENAQQPSTSQEEMIVHDQNSLGDSNEGGETRSTDVDSTVQVPNKGLIPIRTFGRASLNFFWALASIYSLVTLSPTSSFCIKKQPKFPAHSLHQVDQPHECSENRFPLKRFFFLDLFLTRNFVPSLEPFGIVTNQKYNKIIVATK